MACIAVRRGETYETRRAKPFLKWAGGKTQLFSSIRACFPLVFKRYHEPFLGGGAVFFALAPKRAYLCDINQDLINAYCAIRDQPHALIEELSNHRANEAHYYEVRSQHGSLGLIEGAARTIFLNRTCFNGLYRVNRKGEFNVPYGRYNNPTVCNTENLLAVSETLRHVDIRCESVFQIGRRVRRGDLVYFDPPYDPVSASSSFTAYSKFAFGREQQVALSLLFKRLANRGVHVVLSNSDTPFIRDLYKDCNIRTVHARRAINSRADRRGLVCEVLVTA